MRTACREVGAFLRRFRCDRGGQIGITFGLAAIPLILVVGAAIDYSRGVSQRSNLQQASDATVLAMVHTNLSSTSTTATLSGPTQTYLTGALNGAQLANLSLTGNNSTLCIQTTFALPTSLMAIANIKTMNVGASSCATSASGGTSEVAVAVDNSGSMADSAGGQSKMDALKIAAQKLVDILNPSGTANPTISISLVPFTALVNVGPDTNAFFLDKQGKSSIHWQNFHRPPPVLLLAPFYPTSKLDLFSALSPKVAWGGCVEERPVPYITTDTAASTATPDSMFVPFLSPDDPGDTNNGNGCFFISPLTKAVSTSCYVPPAGSGLLNSHYFYNSYLNDLGAANLSAACLLNPLSATYDALVSPLAPPDGQPNVYPLGGETMVCKYNGGKVVSTQVSTNVVTGPNYLCSSQQLTPLTTDRSVLTSAISTMQAGGSTNLATGFMWAWRTISPLVNPFPVASQATIGQQNPKSYTPTTPNQKIIILMTDGTNSWTSNTYSPWLSTFEAFGYYANNRIASYGDCNALGTTVATDDPTTARCQLDNVTLEACTNAKKANIVVYTIGFSTVASPIDAQGLKLLKSCASTDGNFFQASDSAGIVAAFQQIGQNIKGLRLTQ